MIRRAVRGRWDLWTFYAFFALYGVGSVFVESPTMAQAPRPIAIPIYALFVLAALLLTGGSLLNQVAWYVAGSVCAVIALGGVGVIAAVVNTNPGAFLVLALASVLVMRLRRIGRNRQALRTLHEAE